jgi:hypothetical protein
MTSAHDTSRQTQHLPAGYEESVPEDAVYEQYPDPTDNTDPTLLRQGAKSYRRLRGLQSSESTLNVGELFVGSCAFSVPLTRVRLPHPAIGEGLFQTRKGETSIWFQQLPVLIAIEQVFKVYWPEPISQTLTTGKTSVTAGGVGRNNLNREIFAKIRWFVVVKPGEGRYCSCL